MKIVIRFSPKKILPLIRQLVRVGLQAADPCDGLERSLWVDRGNLRVGGRQFPLARFRRVVCVGAGKASATMAVWLEKFLGPRLEGGVVVVKDGYGKQTKTINVLEARHPVPDRRSEKGADSIVSAIHALGPEDLVIVLLSGGASSLVASPAEGLTLQDKQATTRLLLRSGATIHEVNVVRKHLSGVKGGQLLRKTSARVLTLVLSDVLGDDVATVGSGLTAPDSSTFSGAQEILKKYHVWKKIPASVRRRLERGVKGEVPETPKPGAGMFSRVQHKVIGNNRVVLERMAKEATSAGFRTMILTSRLQGEAQDMGRMIGAVASDIRSFHQPLRAPACLLWGGEVTVKVTGNGKGGRAQELALAAAIEIEGLSGTYIVAFGTDGTDGPTDMAGAIVDGDTILRARAQGLDPEQFLANHDSHGFFHRIHGHICTGPTGTNVNDVYMLLVL